MITREKMIQKQSDGVESIAFSNDGKRFEYIKKGDDVQKIIKKSFPDWNRKTHEVLSIATFIKLYKLITKNMEIK